MSASRSALVLVAVGAMLLAAGCGSKPPDQARIAATAFLAAWTRGNDTAASQQADTPAAAAAGLAADRRGLDGATVRATLLSLKHNGKTALARIRVRWQVPRIGAWSYASTLTTRDGDKSARVVWSQTIVNPRLRPGQRLGTTADVPERANILDRNGTSLVKPRAVVRVGLQRQLVSNVAGTAQSVASVLKLQAAPIATALGGAGPKQFVDVVLLRPADYARVAARLRAIAGVSTIDTTAPLAPSRTFAHALLGGVGPVSAEQLARLGDQYTAGDSVGQTGLEATFEHQLAGRPARHVVIRDLPGTPIATLLTRPGVKPRALHTTLDTRVQNAAEQALGSGRKEAALVAVQPSTGDVLAVANRPSDLAFDRALAGLYAPGSTFKIVVTTALLDAGLRPTDSVPCPKKIVVDGKTFKNFEGEAAGPVPFSTDFAQSCNTAFVSLHGRLKEGALTRTARLFGLGRASGLPIPTATSHVPAPRDDVERAASMIGQQRIVASPLALAQVAATVAAGRWRPARIVSDQPPGAAGAPIPVDDLTTLRTLMRAVVTKGTATALARTRGIVRGKTGTAEFGNADPPATHAWFVAYRGDMAIAVLVGRGHSGGSVAAPIAARFFAAYDAG